MGGDRSGDGRFDPPRFSEGAGPGGVPWRPSFRAVSGKGKTLIDTEALMLSIRYSARPDGVTWGSNMHYARIHQFGGEIRPKSASRLAFKVGDRLVFADKVTIPARPFLGIDEEGRITIAGIALDALAEALGGDAQAADVGP